MTDMTVFDVPLNQVGKLPFKETQEKGAPQEVTFSPAEIEALIREQADIISNFDMTKVSKLKDFTMTMHAAMRKDPRLPHMLTPEARAVYFKTLGLHNNLYLEEVGSKALSGGASKKATAKKQLDMLPDDLDLKDLGL